MRAVQKVDLPAPAGPWGCQSSRHRGSAAGRTMTRVPNLLIAAVVDGGREAAVGGRSARWPSGAVCNGVLIGRRRAAAGGQRRPSTPANPQP